MLSDLRYRMRALFCPKQVDAEMDEELAYHLDRESEKYRRRGARPEEATRLARMALAGPEQVRQRCREGRGITAWERLIKGNSPGGGLAETETRSKLSYKGRLSWGGAGSSEGAGLPAR
jgi:hypothetical protein